MNITDKPILRQREVVKVTGLSRSTIFRLRKAGQFPAPTHNLGVRMMAWDTSAVLAWIEAKRVG